MDFLFFSKLITAAHDLSELRYRRPAQLTMLKISIPIKYGY
jgi:hypothetical protein